MPREVEKFAAISHQWWNETSPEFGGLHRMNDVRVPLVELAGDLPGAHVLDVGCGGGILTEALARRGAHVVGVDAGQANVAAAAAHAAGRCLGEGSVTYGAVLVEDLLPHVLGQGGEAPPPKGEDGALLLQNAPAGGFDVVVTSETVEHVADPRAFLRDCASAVRPGGALVVTTINRTAASFALAIVAAEVVLGIVPHGTHSWRQFVTPGEVMQAVPELNLERSQGFAYNPLTGKWCVTRDTSVNYGLVLRKAAQPQSADSERA